MTLLYSSRTALCPMPFWRFDEEAVCEKPGYWLALWLLTSGQVLSWVLIRIHLGWAGQMLRRGVGTGCSGTERMLGHAGRSHTSLWVTWQCFSLNPFAESISSCYLQTRDSSSHWKIPFRGEQRPTRPSVDGASLDSLLRGEDNTVILVILGRPSVLHRSAQRSISAALSGPSCVGRARARFPEYKTAGHRTTVAHI